MIHLNDKKILLIAPKFFGYENEIIRVLQHYGAEVSFIQENIDSTFFIQKVINKLPRFISDKMRTYHFISRLKRQDLRNFDYVFCIRIDLFNDNILSYLRIQCKHAKFILYFWDSVRNMRNAKKIATYFDNVFTFDKNDYFENRSLGWRFRPLFYIDKFKNIPSTTEKSIDLLFIATLSPARAKLYLWLRDFCKKNNLRLYTYFYVKPYVWFVNKNKNEAYKAFPSNILHGSGLSLDDVCEYFRKSKVIVDCSSPTQSGLTMRTIETFGANKKVITTNNAISSYDLYDPHNHLVLSSTEDERLLSFIQDKSFSEPDSKLYNKYSLQGWIEEIFNESNK